MTRALTNILSPSSERYFESVLLRSYGESRFLTNFIDVTTKLHNFKDLNWIQGLFQTTSKIQDLFKIVRTMNNVTFDRSLFSSRNLWPCCCNCLIKTAAPNSIGASLYVQILWEHTHKKFISQQSLNNSTERLGIKFPSLRELNKVK